MKKKSYVYKIMCKITGEYYFGSSFNAKRDWYWGTGRKIKERISLYGKENFIKEILGEFDDRTESHRVENQYIEQFRHDDKCLNKKLEHHFGSFSEESRTKISAANLGKHFSEEHRARIGAANAISQLGKHHTDETRAKMSAARRGENHPMYGKHHTDEARSRMSAANRGEKNPMYGKHWRKNPITGKREYYD